TLGRMMLTFYMPERWTELQQRADHDATSIDAIAPDVLGLSLEEIGHAAALHWGLPNSLINGMRELAPPEPGAEVTPQDWIAALSTMSAKCADNLWHDDADGAAAVQALAESYSGMLGVEPAS